MRYQDNSLAQQYDDLNKKLISASTSSDYTAMSLADSELSTFEELFLGSPRVFGDGHDELSMLLPIIKNNFKKLREPADFHFVNGKLRRPDLASDEEIEIVTHLLTPRIGGFTGRTRVYNWSSVDVNNLAENKVTVSIERHFKKVS